MPSAVPGYRASSDDSLLGQLLFITKGLIYLAFGGVIFGAIAETRQPQTSSQNLVKSWVSALRDRQLVTFLLANIFFALYGAQLSSSLPLYLANFIPSGNTATGFSGQMISYFFFGHALLKIVGQLPITRWAKRIDGVSILLFVLVLWAGAFLCMWLAGIVTNNPLPPTVVGFSLVALAEILYGPTCSSLVSEMAPEEQRGVYFSLESECWAIGFLVGPVLGGWVLDHPVHGGANLWLGMAASTALASTFLMFLKQYTTHLTAAESQIEDPAAIP